MLKRAYLSITRRKSKSILLFIILFVVANLIITTIAIKNATNESTEFAKNSIGSEVTLSVDMQGLRQNIKSEQTEGEAGTRQSIEIPEINIADALLIADSKYISGYSYGFTTYANVVDLETVESEMEKMGEMSMEDVPSFSGNIENGSGTGKKTDMSNMKFDMKDIRDNLVSGDVTLSATNSFNSLSEVRSGTMELVYGEAASLEKDGTVIISYDFAELNELTVGSIIELTHTESAEKIELEVVGIYENSESSSDMRNMLMNSSNIMYVNFATGEKFMTEEKYNDGDCR